MEAKIKKFDTFSKIFAELSNESQNLLIEMANQLLKTHKVSKDVKTERKPKSKKDKKSV